MGAADDKGYDGFYDCNTRDNNLMEESRDMFQHNKKAHIATDFPNATGNTTPPKEVFPNQMPSNG
jgi:hypothetical protein